MSTQPKPQKAHELLSDESKWTKGKFARNANSEPVSEDDPSACRFCIMGAVYKVYPNMGEATDALNKIRCALFGKNRSRWRRKIGDWNDARSRTFPEVHNLLKKLDI